MPSLSHTQTMGFATMVLQALEEQTDFLRSVGIDATAFLARLHAAYERASKLNADQEDLKRQTRATTDELVVAIRDVYVLTSGALDVLVAANRKDSVAGKNFLRLRSRIKRRRKPDEGADEGLTPPAPPDGP